MIPYTNKTVFIAGGTTGINFGIAEAFVSAGARVFVVSRKPDNVENAVTALQKLGRASGTTCDVRHLEQVDAALAACVAEFGQIDVLVSGAAGNFPCYANALSSNGFRSVLEIDLLGTFHVMKAAFPHLRRPGASVINISAPQAFVPMEAQVHVCAAKAGVDMVTRVLAMEWGPLGVRVNSVVPGPIDGTEGMARLAPTPEIKASVAASVPMQRMGLPADVANACMAIASPMFAYVTGAVIPVDGGWALGGASTSMAASVSLGTQLGFLKTGVPSS